MSSIPVTDRSIGPNDPCFIIAEIGANHDGNPDRAFEMIQMAKRAGADAIKLQTYTAEELTVGRDRLVTWGPQGDGIPEGQTVTESVGAMFDRVKLPREAHKELFAEAQRLGMIGFSTPFSPDGVAFLESFDMPLYKVASSDVTDKPLLEAVAETGKPVILSSGKSTLSETCRAIEFLEGKKAGPVILLHCVAMYPAPIEDLSLKTIPALQALWPDRAIGLSDHSMGITAALGAVALGAKVIEKHVTYDQKAIGPDHWFSSDEAELTALVRETRRLEAALGNPRAGILPSEVDERRTSIRSLVTTTALKAGQVITAEHLRAARPGWGIDPFESDGVIGRLAPRDLPAETVLTWPLLRGED